MASRSPQYELQVQHGAARCSGVRTDGPGLIVVNGESSDMPPYCHSGIVISFRSDEASNGPNLCALAIHLLRLNAELVPG